MEITYNIIPDYVKRSIKYAYDKESTLIGYIGSLYDLPIKDKEEKYRVFSSVSSFDMSEIFRDNIRTYKWLEADDMESSFDKIDTKQARQGLFLEYWLYTEGREGER